MARNDPRHLAPAELALMEVLWEEEACTARSLREALYPGSTKAQHGTVQRLLQRLQDKGFIARETALSVHQFSAVVGREEYGGLQLESLMQKLSGGSLAPLLTHLVDEHRISGAEIERLRRVLDEASSAPKGRAAKKPKGRRS